jgi:hypothetical protein
MKLFICFIIFFTLTASSISQRIKNYIPYTGRGVCTSDSSDLILLRSFLKDKYRYYFSVNPRTLNTRIINSDSIRVLQTSWDSIMIIFSSTPYIKAILQAEKESDTLQDAGIKHFNNIHEGIDLTIDMCPSIHPLDRAVFIDLIKEMGRVEKPVPLAISITGCWIKAHPADLHWLDSLDKSGYLSIVWINHTYNHLVKKNVPLKNNFLLTKGININSEVLKTEVILLQKGIVPSVFFRFPGLVSNHDIYDKILSLGLIPVGTDAWLAKGQKPGDGSIVLIHANGNEPLGVRAFIQLLKSKRSDVLSKRWELFDLRESIVNDESK